MAFETVTRDIIKEIDSVRQEREARRTQEIESRLRQTRTYIKPYVEATRHEVVDNWEFYLTIGAMALFVTSLIGRMRRRK